MFSHNVHRYRVNHWATPKGKILYALSPYMQRDIFSLSMDSNSALFGDRMRTELPTARILLVILGLITYWSLWLRPNRWTGRQIGCLGSLNTSLIGDPPSPNVRQKIGLELASLSGVCLCGGMFAIRLPPDYRRRYTTDSPRW